MARQRDEDKKDPTRSGWPQFNTQKRKMVSDFGIFKDMSENRPTATDKGKYAEASFRKWLEQFLPAKYGVTSGYIISQRDSFLPRNALNESIGNTPLFLAKVEGKTLTNLEDGIWSDSIETSPGNHTVCLFDWSESNFALFAFELISIMNGTYRPGFSSSFHGLSFRL